MYDPTSNYGYNWYSSPDLVNLSIPKTSVLISANRILRNGSFSEAATLFYGTGEQAVYHLYTKNTHKQFSYSAMIIMLIINFLLSCYTAGTFLSCGIVVPMLLIGGRDDSRIFYKESIFWKDREIIYLTIIAQAFECS